MFKFESETERVRRKRRVPAPHEFRRNDYLKNNISHFSHLANYPDINRTRFTKGFKGRPYSSILPFERRIKEEKILEEKRKLRKLKKREFNMKKVRTDPIIQKKNNKKWNFCRRNFFNQKATKNGSKFYDFSKKPLPGRTKGVRMVENKVLRQRIDNAYHVRDLFTNYDSYGLGRPVEQNRTMLKRKPQPPTRIFY